MLVNNQETQLIRYDNYQFGIKTFGKQAACVVKSSMYAIKKYFEDLEDSDSEVSDESSGVEYDSDVDQDFDDDPFVESQSDVVKMTTTCEICGVAFKGIKFI